MREGVHVKIDPDHPYRTIGLIGTLGIEITAFIIGGIYLGKYLDRLFHSSPTLLVIGIFVGMLVGIASALLTLKAFIKE